MRSRLLISALALSLLAPMQGHAAEVDGMIAWPWKPRAVVEVHGPQQASSMVDLLNDAIPENGPTLVFVEDEVRNCDSGIPEKGKITICWLPDDSFAYGMAFFSVKKSFMVGGNVGIQHSGVDDPTLYCHELMHAITGLSDRFGTQPGKSCLYDTGMGPGSWDRDFLAKLYASDRVPPKKRHHKKHR